MKKNEEIYGTIYPFNSDDVYELISFAPGKNAIVKYNLAISNLPGCGEISDVYPNPANNELNIDVNLSEDAFEADVEIKITDVIGKHITSKSVSEKNYTWQLNTARFTPGVYFIQLSGKNFTETRKIVITK